MSREFHASISATSPVVGGKENPKVLPAKRVPSKYAGVVPVAIGTFLILGFFAAHQIWATGFFTPAFGLLETTLFYASILFGILTATASVFLREDQAIVIQLAGAILWSVTTVWLLILFPFNFLHLADVVPVPLQFLLSWINQGIGKMIWAIVTIGSVAFVPFFVIQLARARIRIQKQE